MNNPSLLSTPTSNTRPFLSSPFLNPAPLCLTPHSLPKRRRFKVSFPRNCSASTSTATTSSDIWGPRKELVGIEPVVDKLSPPVRLATSAVIIAGAMFAGFNLGSTFGRSRNVAIGGAAVLGASGGAMAYAMNAAVPEVAAKRLHDYVADCDDPGAVKKEDIEAIAKKLVQFLAKWNFLCLSILVFFV